MSKVQIFKNYKEFEKRYNWEINGVTKKILKKNNLTLEILVLLI